MYSKLSFYLSKYTAMNKKRFLYQKIRAIMHPVGQNIEYCCFELFIQTNQFGFTYIYANTVILLKAI